MLIMKVVNKKIF